MPCLFVRNAPPVTAYNSVEVGKLYEGIAQAVGCAIEDIEVHLENTQYNILKPNAEIVPAKDIHIFVEWTGRPFKEKRLVATAINEFFKAHGLDSDTTFRDSGPGTFFVNGKLIGPEPSDIQAL